MKKNYPLVLAIALPVQIIGIKILSYFPYFIERYYSHGLYPILAKTERFLFGWLPFSLGDLLYIVGVFLILRWVYLRIKTRFRNFKTWSINTLAFISVVYACFHLLWGLNYYRFPLHVGLKIDNTYTTEELAVFTKKLIQKTNRIHFHITHDDSLKVKIPYSSKILRQKTVLGYTQLKTKIPGLSYSLPSIKSSLFSVPLTYMGFNGYLNPWTNEAQINTELPKFKIPSTASHEVGHQLGYAKENEANFMACLVTLKHPDIYFRYGGYTFALQYCLNELYRRKPKETQKLIKTLAYGVRLNYVEMQDFWAAHKNPFEPLFKIFYSNYLQLNNQPEGIKSYSYVVALLVNYFQQEKTTL